MLLADLQHNGPNCVLGQKPWVESGSSSRKQLSVQTLSITHTRVEARFSEEWDGKASEPIRRGKIKKKLWLKVTFSVKSWHVTFLASSLIIVQSNFVLTKLGYARA